MSKSAHRTVLITGANTGIGKDTARQLALRDDVQRVYLACRNDEKAALAAAELAEVTGRNIFKTVRVDVADLDSVHLMVNALDEPLDALIMNAGGYGGPSPSALTDAGVTNVFASNVYGHVVMLEELLARDGLTKTAMYVSSEAARGVPRLRLPRPFTEYSYTEFIGVIDGSYYQDHRYNMNVGYGQVKMLGSLWIAAKARQYPGLRLISMSPGGTAGTDATRDMSRLTRQLMNRVVMPHVMPRFGLAHSLEAGAARLVEGLTNPTLRSGSFYASAAKVVAGPITDQAAIIPELSSSRIQDDADAAIHRFLP